MKASSLNFLLLLIGFSLFNSCKKNDNSGNGSGSCINQTGWAKDGHLFTYVNNSNFIFADSLYVNIQEVSSGIFKSTSTFDDGTIYPVVSVYVQPCGNSIYQSTAADMANKQEVYRIDGNVGDNWTATIGSLGGMQTINTISIAAKNVSVTVPAGTFKCIQLHTVTTVQGQTLETEMYLNNTYGPIKVEGTTTAYELARINF